jgi:2-dehydropantoate 2-reductase
MQASGLRVRTPHLDVTTKPVCLGSIGEAEIGDGDVVLLAVKSQDTDVAMRDLSAVAHPDAVIVCLQNGLENERLAARRFATVLSVPVMLPAAILEPGVVVAYGGPYPAVLDIGRYPDQLPGSEPDPIVRALAETFVIAGMLSTPRIDIGRWKRRKLLMNLGNAMQALVGIETAPGGYARTGELMQRAVAEGEACFAAAALDVASLGEDAENRSGRMGVVDVPGVERGGGSSWQSLVRGSGSIEADFLNGEVCLLGRLHGVPTPVNDLLRRRANAAAASGLAPGSTTELELLAELEAER